MVDLIFLIIGLIALSVSIVGALYYFSDNNRRNNLLDEDNIRLLREEKLKNYRKPSKRKKWLILIKKLKGDDINYFYQLARKNKISVGELLLLNKIKAYK